jgi:hypothetical protein
MKNYLGLVIFAVSLLVGCTPAITTDMLPLAEGLQPQTTAEMEEFRQGRSSFLRQCAGCHYHIWPSEYTPRQWKLTLKEHIGRTHLNKLEYQHLRDYIVRGSELSHAK